MPARGLAVAVVLALLELMALLIQVALEVPV
jgi:hypothetical protein